MKTSITFLSGLLLAAVITTNAVKADDLQTRSDVRCMAAAFVSLSLAKDPDTQAAFQSSVIYYLGRIDGRSPDGDLEMRLTRELMSMSREDLQREDARCAEALKTRGSALIEAGRNLQRRAEQ